MTGKHATRRSRWRGSSVGLAGGTLATAVIGIAAAQTNESTPARLLGSPSDTGPDAFTIGAYTFDPYTTPLLLPQEGWATFPASEFPGPPLMDISGGSLDGINLAPQNFEVFNSSGTDVGSIGTAGTIIDLLGQPSYEYTVTSATPVLLGSAANLPAVGSVYDIFDVNLPLPGLLPLENIYAATPGGAVNDFVVTPSGVHNIDAPVVLPDNLGTLDLHGLLTQNFTGNLSPGNAFSSLVATSGDSSIGPDAFTINVPGFNYTLDPFDTLLTPDTYTAVAPLAGFPPLLAAGGANFFGISAITQGFNVYDAGGSNMGSVDASEFVTQILGVTTTEEVVTSQTPNLLGGFTDANLPAVGTVFSVTNATPFNLGFNDEIYLATPTGGATITDVSPLGSSTVPAPFNVDSAGNATINPASIFANLVAEQPQNASIPPPLIPGTPATDAFTINGLTFYPETSALTEGYNNIAQTMGGLPLMAVFGGSGAGINLGAQDFWYYTGSGAGATNEGELSTNLAIVDMLLFQNAAFTVTGCASLICTNAPADGTVFDVLNLGSGFENLYEATPSGSVSDILWTPFGPLVDFTIPAINAAIAFTPADIVPPGLDIPF